MTPPETPNVGSIDVSAISHDSMLKLAGTLSLALDADGCVTWASDSMIRLIGGTADDLVGRDWFETFVAKSEREDLRARFYEVTSGRPPGTRHQALRIRSLDGGERITEWRSVPLRDPSGQVVGLLCAGYDVTEARHSAAMLDGLRRLVSLWTGRIHVARAESLDAVITEALAAVGRCLEVDAVNVALLATDGSIEPLATWSNEALGTTARFEALMRSMPSTRFREVMIRTGRFEISEDIPLPEWPREEQIHETFGTPSVLAVRSGGDDESVEAIAAFSKDSRSWLEEFEPPLICLSGAIWGASHRRRAEADLLRALAEVTRLKTILEAENDRLRQEFGLTDDYLEIIGRSPALRLVLEQVERVAPTNASVLLLGETGTGKELIARAIHRLSGRGDRPMVCVNCAAMPPGLADTELFGRDKGAYTGAGSSQPGRFELADGSTLFLDEVTELDLGVQAKLLRVLQEGKFERVGGTKTIAVDVRLITASNRDPAALVEDGSFRQDLLYRLNVFPIEIPPLRERREDIPPLVAAFAKEFGEAIGRRIDQIPEQTMAALQDYGWPGNVRELRNVIERAVILSAGNRLNVEIPQSDSAPDAPAVTLEEIERQHIGQMLERTGWRVRGPSGTAELLGIKPTTLESRMRKLGIERPPKTPPTSP